MNKIIEFIIEIIKIFFKKEEDSLELPSEKKNTNEILNYLLKTEEFKCKCGCQKDIDLKFDKKLLSILEILVDEFKEKIIIDSGYRCLEHNKNVGGAINSYHTKLPVMCADLRIKDVSAKEIYKFLDTLFDTTGLGYYLNTKTKWEFIHLDTRGTKARWVRIDSKYLLVTQDILEKYDLK